MIVVNKKWQEISVRVLFWDVAQKYAAWISLPTAMQHYTTQFYFSDKRLEVLILYIIVIVACNEYPVDVSMVGTVFLT